MHSFSSFAPLINLAALKNQISKIQWHCGFRGKVLNHSLWEWIQDDHKWLGLTSEFPYWHWTCYTLSSTQSIAPAKQTAAHKFIKDETLCFDTLSFLAQIFRFRNLKIFLHSLTSLDKIPSWSISYSLNIHCNLHSSLRLVRIAKPSKNFWNSRLNFQVSSICCQ